MPSILDRLAEMVPELPNKLAMAARFALDNPDMIAVNSMRAVAAEVGVASPTMLRLARMLDYESYEDFKAAFQDEVIGAGFSARAGRLRRGGAAGEEGSLLDRMRLAALANVEKTFTECDPEVMSRMARTLLEAESVYVVGVASAYSLATLLQFTGHLALPDLRVPIASGAPILEALGSVEEGDVVLTFGISPYATRTVETLALARERGATTLAITDRRSSPVLEYADLYLLAEAKSPHYFPSFVAVVALVEALLATVVAEGGEKVLERMNRIEMIREKTGAYVT